MSNSAATQYPRKALFAALLSAFSFGSCQAADLMVTSLGDVGGACPGSNCTLRAALSTVEFGDVITFDPGFTYPAVITLTNGELLVSQDAIVKGPGPDKLTVSANDLSRVLTIESGVSVKLSGLTLAEGYDHGADGADGVLNGFHAQAGENAFGGCIWVKAASLYLERVAVRNCVARGGNGGDGAGSFDSPEFDEAQGADGGFVFGGAVYLQGYLELIESSVAYVAAVGGNGGDGGYAWDNGGRLAQGGVGGWVNGGAIGGSGMNVINSSVLRADATGGTGGDGGTNSDGSSGSPGGNGGDVTGGAISSLAQSNFAFTTIESQHVEAGLGGVGGSGTSSSGPDGADGYIVGSVIYGSNLWFLRNSAIIDAQALTHPADSTCEGPVTTNRTYATDSSCGADFVAPADSAFSASTRLVHGLAELPPLSTSLVIDAVAECIDFNDAPVSTDQAGRARPFDGNGVGGAQCDIGAVELDHDGIFTNGFD